LGSLPCRNTQPARGETIYNKWLDVTRAVHGSHWAGSDWANIYICVHYIAYAIRTPRNVALLLDRTLVTSSVDILNGLVAGFEGIFLISHLQVAVTKLALPIAGFMLRSMMALSGLLLFIFF